MESIRRILPPAALVFAVSASAPGQASAQTVIWAGLEHTPLGEATLTISPDDQLLVSNLGNSGLDGISTALPAGTRGECVIADVHFAGGAAAFTFEHVGSIDGAWGPIGTCTYTEIPGGGVQLTADFSPIGSSTQLVQIWDQGTLVAEFPGQTGGLVELSVPATGRYEGFVRPDPEEPTLGLFSAAFKIPVSAPIPAGPDGEVFVGDRVVVTPENPTSSVDDLQGVAILCSGVDLLVLSDVILFVPTATGDEPVVPRPVALLQNVPNPFNPSTSITFDLPRRVRVDLSVYDARGARVRTLASGVLRPGQHRRVWQGRDDRGLPVASGVYFYRLESDLGTVAKRMTLVR